MSGYFNTFVKCPSLCALAVAALVPFEFAYANGFSVLWQLQGHLQGDGAYPAAGLISDSAGNLYGTTVGGGASYAGTVFRLAPDGTETVLYSFKGGNDGDFPEAGLIADGVGNLYGTTSWGGTGACGSGCGTVFELAPDGTETVLYSFQYNGIDGIYPEAGLVMDQAGNLYGTTEEGGTGACYGNGCGTVFELSPDGTEAILHSFTGGDGALPFYGSLIMDQAGNLYGMTSEGGSQDTGTIFKLSTDDTETVLHSCTRDGSADCASPYGGLTMDQNGNLYGTSELEGGYGNGIVFKLAPDDTFTVLYAFAGGSDGMYPIAGVILDKSGNLYGTTVGSARFGRCRGSCGTVFKLAPDGTETVLHSFSGRATGTYPVAGLVVGENGYLYGTTYQGGNGAACSGRKHPKGCGTVFRLKK